MSQEETLSVFSFVIKVREDGIRKSMLVNLVSLCISLYRGQRLALAGFHPLRYL